MKNALRKLRLIGSLLMFAVSLFATNSPAPAVAADTNFIDPQILEENPQVKQLKEALEREGIKPETLLDEHFLFASLIWGSVGAGYLLYAKKQREIMPFLGGVVMIAVSYFVTSWFWMSLICIGVAIAVYQLKKRGY